MPLNTSDRINLIKEVAKKLSSEEWSLIDLTLRQFGFPTNESWNRDSKYSYIFEMLPNESDEKILNIAQHVGCKFEQPRHERIEPTFWEKGMFKVFISHLASHRETATELQQSLLGYGITSFVAHNDIEPTQEWQTQIEAALATCNSMIALLNEDFHKSDWTDQEIGFAMGRGLPVYSVKFGQDPYGFIGRFQAFNGNNKEIPVLARELFDAYRSREQTQPQIAEALVTLFENSVSFEAAKQNIAYLENLNNWTPSFSERIETALKSNSQIYDSWGVPGKINSLLKKWSTT